MVREFCIYGVIFIVVLSVYFVVQMNMVQVKYRYRRTQYQLLKNLGMDNVFFTKLSAKEGGKEGLWLLFGIPLSYVLSYLGYYHEEVVRQAQDLLLGRTWSMYSRILKDYTSDPKWMASEVFIRATSMKWTMIFVGTILLLKILMHYIPTRQFIKSEEEQSCRKY